MKAEYAKSVRSASREPLLVTRLVWLFLFVSVYWWGGIQAH